MYEYVNFIVVFQPVRICVNQNIYLLDQSATASERSPSVLNFVLFVLLSFQLNMLCFVYSHLSVSRFRHSIFSLFSSHYVHITFSISRYLQICPSSKLFDTNRNLI